MSDSVLFVDDEANILNAINRTFADMDLRILNASNADEALDIINKENISVIISDNMMPGMIGIDLLSKVKEFSPDTLKILMTGHADLTTAVDAINKGEVFRFIMKPWNDKALRQTVQEAVERYNIIRSMKNLDEATLFSLAQAIELKDPYTRGHSERVCHYALLMAEELELSAQEMKQIKFGGWLHDCGKIGLPEKILNKNGPLDPEEYDMVKNHPRWGADVAMQAQLSSHIIDIIHYHHERFDGSGYPSGLKGEDIPLEARITTVADVFDALTSDRAYRGKYNIEKALDIMIQMKGIVLDPELMELFLDKCLPNVRNYLNPNSEIPADSLNY